MSLAARFSPGGCGCLGRRRADVVCERDLRVPMTTAPCCWPTAGSPVRLANARADGARALAVRPPPTGRGDLRAAARRTRAPGPDPERSRHVRLRGDFSPFDERADGLATLRWLRASVARGPDRDDRAELPRARAVGRRAGSRRRSRGAGDPGQCVAVHGQTYAGGSLSLETAASWLVLVAGRSAGWRCWRWPGRCAGCRSCSPSGRFRTRPADHGAQVDGSARASESRARGTYWVARDFAAGVAKYSAGAVRRRVAGHLPAVDARGLQALRDAGRETQLVIGPWTHTAPGLMAAGMREGLGWLRARLLDDDRLVRRHR